MKKILFSGVVAGVAALLLSLVLNPLINVFFPSLAGQYANPQLFRPWSDPLMSLFFLYPILTGLILAFVWDKIKGVISGKTSLQKGAKFGVLYWLFTGLTGMLITYSTFPVSLLMILSWSFTGLVETVGASLVIAKINGETA